MLIHSKEKDLTADNGGKLLQLAGGDVGNISAATVSQAAAQGDKLAGNLLSRAAWALGVGIGNAANLVNPERVIIGGGVIKAGERFLQDIRTTVAKITLPEIKIELLKAALGDDAPLWGALGLSLEGLKGRLDWE
jgi:glucokinase